MEKVKITKEVAETIEDRLNYYSKPDLIRITLNKKWVEDYPLFHVEPETLIKALYIGYEVVADYSLGDCLYDEVEKKVLRLVTQCQVDSINNYPKNFRYATKQEVWWFRHGRCVWELKKGDVIRRFVMGGDVFEVTCVIDDYVGLFNISNSRKETEEIDIVSGGYRVMCFAQARKDI